jgi:large-conductance mechanosensitive channel
MFSCSSNHRQLTLAVKKSSSKVHRLHIFPLSNRKSMTFTDKLEGGIKRGAAAGGSVLTDFKAFINKGNVVDLAIAVIMYLFLFNVIFSGAAFSAIVKSVVEDLITPIIGLAGDKQLENIFAYLEKPDVCKIRAAEFNQTVCDSLNTLELAQEAGLLLSSLTLRWCHLELWTFHSNRHQFLPGRRDPLFHNQSIQRIILAQEDGG